MRSTLVHFDMPSYFCGGIKYNIFYVLGPMSLCQMTFGIMLLRHLFNPYRCSKVNRVIDCGLHNGSLFLRGGVDHHLGTFFRNDGLVAMLYNIFFFVSDAAKQTRAYAVCKSYGLV